MGLTLRLSAFWAATPHQILACQDVTFYYVVTVPLAWVACTPTTPRLSSARLSG
jgi:hypothetical protein